VTNLSQLLLVMWRRMATGVVLLSAELGNLRKEVVADLF